MGNGATAQGSLCKCKRSKPSNPKPHEPRALSPDPSQPRVTTEQRQKRNPRNLRIKVKVRGPGQRGKMMRSSLGPGSVKNSPAAGDSTGESGEDRMNAT